MSTESVERNEWAMLRFILRECAAGKPPTGKAVRWVNPSRRTKDGAFLGRWEAAGLVERVEPGPDVWSTTWKLTTLGERAAEFGEYEPKGEGRP